MGCTQTRTVRIPDIPLKTPEAFLYKQIPRFAAWEGAHGGNIFAKQQGLALQKAYSADYSIISTKINPVKPGRSGNLWI